MFPQKRIRTKGVNLSKFIQRAIWSKALRKMEFSELFVFASFRIVRFSKFRNIRSFRTQNWNSSLEIMSCFWVKKPCFSVFWGQKQGFPNIPNLRKIQKLFYSKLSENYKKMTLKSNFGNLKKLVPTQKLTQMFGLKFRMQALTQNTMQA